MGCAQSPLVDAGAGGCGGTEDASSVAGSSESDDDPGNNPLSIDDDSDLYNTTDQFGSLKDISGRGGPLDEVAWRKRNSSGRVIDDHRMTLGSRGEEAIDSSKKT